MPISMNRVSVEAASLVCTVESTRWPGKRGAHGYLGRLEVADFADHDDVRVVPQKRSQSRREGQTDLGMDLHLRNPVHLVLDRVFHGQHLRRTVLQYSLEYGI